MVKDTRCYVEDDKELGEIIQCCTQARRIMSYMYHFLIEKSSRKSFSSILTQVNIGTPCMNQHC